MHRLKKHFTMNNLEWIGSAAGLLGAFTIAMNLDISKYAFFIFSISAGAWLISAIEMKKKSLIWLNIGYLSINVLGLYRWFF